MAIDDFQAGQIVNSIANIQQQIIDLNNKTNSLQASDANFTIAIANMNSLITACGNTADQKLNNAQSSFNNRINSVINVSDTIHEEVEETKKNLEKLSGQLDTWKPMLEDMDKQSKDWRAIRTQLIIAAIIGFSLWIITMAVYYIQKGGPLPLSITPAVSEPIKTSADKAR